jgi:Ribonuclease G/E
MIASASMLLAAPAAVETTPAANTPQAGGMFIMKKMQAQKGQNGMMQQCKGKMNSKKRMMKQKMKLKSPFLIKHGIPHLTKMIMPYMNDPVFNLTKEQKIALSKVRVDTMDAIMQAKQKVAMLRKEIIKASQAGVSSDKLKDKVTELALVEAATTMTHLKCIEETKAILTKDQLYFLLANKKSGHGKKRMMPMNK